MPSTKLPPLPLDVASHLATTPHLTTVEQGALMLLYMSYWTSGQPLMNNDMRLATITRLPLDADIGIPSWKAARKQLQPFFLLKNGLWNCRWLEKARERALQTSQSRRNNAIRTNKLRYGIGLSESLSEEKALLNLEESMSPTERSWLDFWYLYPRKTDKSRCERTFIRLVDHERIPPKVILEGLRILSGSPDWNKENGRFVPNPSRFLTGHYWEQVIDMKTLRPKLLNQPTVQILGNFYTKERQPKPEDFESDTDYLSTIEQYNVWVSQF